MRLAQLLLDEPRMFNHHRGLWGYTGVAQDGHPLTVQSTGMGGPSAAIVISELALLGASTLVRVGTCGSLTREIGLGQLLVAEQALAADGTSRALTGVGELAPISADPALTQSLLAVIGPAGDPAARAAKTVSTDLFYDAEQLHQSWRAAGAQVVEMEAAALFALAQLRGLRAACVLLVSDALAGGHVRIDPETLAAAELMLGELAVAGLTSDYCG